MESKLTIDEDGNKIWKLPSGDFHKEDGPAIEYIGGDKHLFLNDKIHRENGPAVEYINGYKAWYINGQYHREDGPAVEYASGAKRWCLNGKQYTENEYKYEMRSRKLKKLLWNLN